MKNWLFTAIIVIGVVAYNFATRADRDATGAIVDAGSVDAWDLQVGDCFDDTSAVAEDGAGEVASLPAVPCSEPHDNEVYAVIDLGISTYSDDETVSQLAFDKCHERFESFVGMSYDDSELDILTLSPTKASFSSSNRDVTCAVFNVDYSKLTGSAEGTAR